LAFEAIGVDEGHKELEVGLFAVVGGGGKEEEMAGEAGEELGQSVALGVGNLAAEVRGGHLVGLVAYDQVPIGGLEPGLDVLVAAQVVEAADGQVDLGEGVAGAGVVDRFA